MTATMRAIRVHRPGGPAVLQIEEITVPEPRPGRVRIRVQSTSARSPGEACRRCG